MKSLYDYLLKVEIIVNLVGDSPLIFCIVGGYYGKTYQYLLYTYIFGLVLSTCWLQMFGLAYRLQATLSQLAYLYKYNVRRSDLALYR